MSDASSQSDSTILKRLRKPIDELIKEYCFNVDDYSRMKLRQLTWQAVDILVKTEDIPNMRGNENIRRIISHVREIGGSKKFINESLKLAVKIYEEMKTHYPTLYNRYRGEEKQLR